MRKPLVVVCVVTSAVLIAGGIAATTAGAQTTPAQTTPAQTTPDDAMPAGTTPDAPALPGLSAPGDLPDLSDLPALPDLPAEPGGAAMPDDLTRPGTQDQPAAQGQPAGPDQAGDQGQAVGDPAAPARPGAAGQDEPAVQRPQLQHQPAAQHPATSTLAAAQQEVTTGSVSTSPAAPVQQQVLGLVNENRGRGGCDDLSLDRRLIMAAQGHATDMARGDYFAHESRNGDGAGDRVTGEGYRWKRYGENIARGVDSPYEVVDGWMHSPAHRENIMDCTLHQMGIGLAFDGAGTPYWVQDFATPMA
jgi:uncharacterized protein YkwD